MYVSVLSLSACRLCLVHLQKNIYNKRIFPHTNVMKNKKTNAISFANDFVFYSVLTLNEEICREVISLCIKKKIRKIVYAKGQEAIKLMLEGKGIRLDVYAEDEDHTLYDIEMQVAGKTVLGRRSRYYDSIMTLNAMEEGDRYDELPDSYVIFICAFDPFGMNRAMYSFSTREDSDSNLVLDDGSHKIMLNAYGDTAGCSKGLKQLLAAVRGETISEDGLDRKIEKAVKRLKENDRWNMEYIAIESFKTDYERIGLVKGRAEGRDESTAVHIQNVMSSLGVSVDKAMEILQIPDSDRDRYREAVKARNAEAGDQE